MSLIGQAGTPASYVADYMQACVGMFGIPAGGFTADIEAFGADTNFNVESLYAAMLNSSIGRSIYTPGASNTTLVTKLVDKLGGSLLSDATKAAVIDLGKSMLDGGDSLAKVCMTFVEAVSNIDTTDPDYGTVAQQFANRIEIANYYTFSSTNPSSTLTTLTAVLSTVTNSTDVSDPAAVVAANSNSGVSTGQTYTLTTNVDTLVGTTGNDTFIADSSNTSVTSAADSIDGGAGTDTLKVYAKAGTAVTLPTLTSVETLYVNGDNQGLDISAATSLTALTLDAYAGSVTYTVKGGSQSVTLQNHTAGGLTETLATGTGTSLNLTVNAVGKSTSVETVDLSGTSLATLNLSTTGAASTIALTNTGAKLATLNISGDQAVTLTGASLSAATMKTINASTATGNVSVDATNAVTDKAFAFTGGSGNDTLKLKAAEFGTLTAGSQLDGGAGTDTLQVNDTTMNYTGLNAVKNFEVLELGTTAATVDIAQLTSFNKFAVASGNLTETFNNAKSTSTFAIDNSGSTTKVTIANKVGETATTVAISNTAGSAQTLGTLAMTGATTVALSSTGVATKAGGSNVITTFSNADNSAITLTGDTGLTLTLSGTTTGSKLDGSAFTGALIATGSAKADVLIGGSGADTLTTGGGADALTGGAGKDTFVISSTTVAGTASAPIEITDFATGTDVLKILKAASTGPAKGTPVVTSAKVDVTAATTLAGALDLACTGDGSTNAAIKWLTYGGDTYVVVDNTAATTLAATDAVIKLTGITSITTSTDIVVA